jgi:hypothetical protein
MFDTARQNLGTVSRLTLAKFSEIDGKSYYGLNVND